MKLTAKFSTWLFLARNSLNGVRRGPSPRRVVGRNFCERWRASHSPEPDLQTTGPTDSLLRDELEAKVEEAIAELPRNNAPRC
jgi:hypothetical protein